jgi:hypothetical protein
MIMKYEDLTYKIVGCAMEVHKHLGNGFQEIGLLINFGSKSLQYKRVHNNKVLNRDL